jgi:hypothetical protein
MRMQRHRRPMGRLACSGLAIAAMLAAPGHVAAQSAGSPLPPPTYKPKPQTNIKPSRPAWDIAGRWVWTAKCTTGTWKGGWNIVSTSPGHFTGGYTGTNIADVGTVVNGRLKGDSISFLHQFKDILGVPHDDHVNGRLTRAGTGLRIDGTSGDATFSCTFWATK